MEIVLANGLSTLSREKKAFKIEYPIVGYDTTDQDLQAGMTILSSVAKN